MTARAASAAGLALIATACTPAAPRVAVPPPVTAVAIVTIPVPSGLDGVMAEARRFVYRVRNRACLATGTAFSFGGTIITNRHVAAGADHLDMATWDGADFQAPVGGHAGAADLARLDTTPPGADAPPGAAASDPTQGQAVFVAGYPDGDQLAVTPGVVKGTTSAQDLGVSAPVLEISNQVKPGNSGSPVLDSSGRVVGVVFAFDGATGDGLAMPVSILRGFVQGRADERSLPCTE